MRESAARHLLFDSSDSRFQASAMASAGDIFFGGRGVALVTVCERGYADESDAIYVAEEAIKLVKPNNELVK